ncbi:hypothetical protein [Gardnerella vaginalis]
MMSAMENCTTKGSIDDTAVHRNDLSKMMMKNVGIILALGKLRFVHTYS